VGSLLFRQREAPRELQVDQALMHAALNYEERSSFINTPGKKFPTFHAFLVRRPFRRVPHTSCLGSSAVAGLRSHGPQPRIPVCLWRGRAQLIPPEPSRLGWCVYKGEPPRTGDGFQN